MTAWKLSERASCVVSPSRSLRLIEQVQIMCSAINVVSASTAEPVRSIELGEVLPGRLRISPTNFVRQRHAGSAGVSCQLRGSTRRIAQASLCATRQSAGSAKSRGIVNGARVIERMWQNYSVSIDASTRIGLETRCGRGRRSTPSMKSIAFINGVLTLKVGRSSMLQIADGARACVTRPVLGLPPNRCAGSNHSRVIIAEVGPARLTTSLLSTMVARTIYPMLSRVVAPVTRRSGSSRPKNGSRDGHAY